MAPRHIQILEIGASQLSCGGFAVKAGRLVLDYWDSEAIDAEWSAGPARVEQLVPKLVAFAARQPKRACLLVLPAHLVLTRIIPIATNENRGAIMLDPAEHIPLSLSDVVWGWRELGDDDMARPALIVAARRVHVERISEALIEAGLTIDRVVPAALGMLAAGSGANEPTAIASVGARRTLLAALTDRLRLVRAIPIGDRHDDPAWEGRLENEIRRTLAHWAQKFGLAAPRTLQLAALDGGIGLERLRRGLAMNVVPYDVFAALVSARAPGVAPVSLGPEMAGAAAAVLLRREPLIELSPAAVVTERTTRRRMRLRFATAALAAIAFVPPVLYHRAQAAQTLRRAQEAERELRLVASVQAIDAARQREIEQLQARVQALLPAYMARDGWSRFLAELQEEVSAVENAWIERLQVVGPPLGRAGTVAEARRLLVSGRLEADGAASAAERARHLLGRVAASVFVAAIEGEQFERAGNGSLRFTVTLVLKPGAML